MRVGVMCSSIDVFSDCSQFRQEHFVGIGSLVI